MTEIPLKPKNDQNTPENKKITKIPPKPKKELSRFWMYFNLILGFKDISIIF